MKNFVKIIFSLGLLSCFGMVGFASAKSTTFTTKDCYRKNHNYQCTIKTCKTAKPKSCTYKIVKATPPVYNVVKTPVVVDPYIPNYTIINTTGTVIMTGSTGIALSGTATSSGVIGTGTVIMTGSTGTKSSITNISNTSNTIEGLSKFYEKLSGNVVINNFNAKYSIVEFADFECTYCKTFHLKKVLDIVMSNYTNNVNYYFVNYPLKSHKNAAYLAKGYICAVMQDAKQATTYINYIYSQTNTDPIVLLDEYKKGLDVKGFDGCMLDSAADKILDYQISIGDYVGITGTPTVMLINNETSEYEVIAGAYDTGAYNSILQNRQDKMKK